MTELVLRNFQRTRSVNSPLLRRLTRALLTDAVSLERCELAVYLVAAPKMARMNRQFLNHSGATDVLTFDYGEPGRRNAHFALRGEIFICIEEAVSQAKRFRTTWQSELVRYLIHGVLHLAGHDDLTPVGRRVMKREENRLLRRLSRQFSLKQLANAGRVRKSQAVHRRS